MKNIQFPQITKDRLLKIEVGESGYIIMPIDKQDKNSIKNYKFCCDVNNSKPIFKPLLEFMPPLQQGDNFYIGEDLYGAISTKTLGLSGMPVGISKVTTKKRFSNLSLDDYFVVHCFKEIAELEKMEQEHLYNIPTSIKKTMDADQVQPCQSRFHGECLSVKIVKINSIVLFTDMLNKLKYNAIVFQHNKLHNTNITPSMDDYVFLIEIRRDK